LPRQPTQDPRRRLRLLRSPSLDPNKAAPVVCGCGVAVTAENTADSGGDGVPNCKDAWPSDPNKSAPGVCGCGISDHDTDGDGTPDCLERS
jgi:hypothetical protein